MTSNKPETHPMQVDAKQFAATLERMPALTRATPTRFRMDNTEGYDAADLLALNAAWQQIIRHGAVEDSDEIAMQSLLDHWEQKLLYAYDQGARGDNLTAWFYKP